MNQVCSVINKGATAVSVKDILKHSNTLRKLLLFNKINSRWQHKCLKAFRNFPILLLNMSVICFPKKNNV